MAANVLTEAVAWQAATLASGLYRLKEHVLDESRHRDVEFVGAVFRTRSGAFRFTQGQGRAGQNRVTFRVRPPADTELVGFWHTHGADGPAQAAFSDTDVNLVRASGLPFYLIAPDGKIRVLRPEHVRAGSGIRFRGLPRGAHPGERLRG
ncbi:MAG: DUF4329 domain-containing protein [Pseudomonadales bacterium]